jgi:hypothetical protein
LPLEPACRISTPASDNALYANDPATFPGAPAPCKAE